MRGQLAWYIGGPVLGLCVVACRLLFNGRLGVTGGFSELVDKLRHRSVRFDWRGWFAIGILAGGTIYALSIGGPGFEGYGWLTDAFTGTGRIVMAGLLVVAGVAIGFGAKTAGGCTSGNGLAGSSLLSPAALVATATFFATGIAVSLVTQALT
ncbi:MAG: uncharacterized protein QOH46_4097 [Solirubrobacteraceae bacterium]|nr:uncharacterized protein [Solirubrobacteraceae bacterium]